MQQDKGQQIRILVQHHIYHDSEVKDVHARNAHTFKRAFVRFIFFNNVFRDIFPSFCLRGSHPRVVLFLFIFLPAPGPRKTFVFIEKYADRFT